ncbi:MAG: hypothetical protein FWC01_05365 [Treponema sp.]|nr:hypothetical protein [Treponema sp.]MCL2237295.1 hypothetical protein [Treponema sp.]
MKSKRESNACCRYGQISFFALRGFFFLCVFCIVPVAKANDFGVILDQTASYGGIEENSVEYSGNLIPRYQALLGNNGELYISAGFKYEYIYETPRFVPELLRTEVSFQFDRTDLTAGRMFYSDPLGFVASGLFDGARMSLISDYGSFGIGAWYTGFLYKERANIAMTESELESFMAELDFGNFSNTYFAPKRFLAAFDWEHLNLGSLMAWASLIAQFDIEGSLNSQYVTGKVTWPIGIMSIDLGGCAQLIQDDGEFGFAWAGVVGVRAVFGKSGVSLLGRFTGANFGYSPLSAFIPVTTNAMGEIFNVKLSGVSCITAEYSIRPLQKFSVTASGTCFILSDNETFSGYPVSEGNDGYFLGTEILAKIMWSPFSDLQFNLKGGAFLPSLGNAARDAGVQWRIELNVIFGL